MADIVQVTGFILSSMPVGEYDRRIVILSKELGKISAFAKGARRPNSHLIGVTRPFIFGTFECYRGRDSYTIFKAEVKNYFEELVSDLDSVWYGYYFAEIAEYYGKENLDAVQMLNLLYVSFKALTNKSIPNELIRFIYELRMISVNGECPDFFTCRGCGSHDKLDTYSYTYNGMFCSDCHSKVKDGIKLQPSTLYTLQYIVTAALNKLYTFVVTDEVYEHMVYAPNRHVCMASLPGMYEHTITCNSLSKTYSITGWRLGYLIGPEEVIEGAKKVHDFLTVGAAAPLQEAAVTGLNFPESYYEELLALYTKKRAYFLKGLDEIGLKHNVPQGTYFVMIDIQEFLDLPQFQGWTDLEFCEWMIKNIGVAAVPGSSFFREEVNHLIRLHFAREEKTIDEALKRLKKLQELLK